VLPSEIEPSPLGRLRALVIEVLWFSDRSVKQKLFARAKQAKRPLVVVAVPSHRAVEHPERLEPFASLEREHGDVVDQLLVVDEGKKEGMWRDPVTDLADALWPDDSKAAYGAARGAFVVQGFRPLAVVAGSRSKDALGLALREALARVVPGMPRPQASTTPKGKPAAKRRPAATTVQDEAPPRPTADEEAEDPLAPALAVLGLSGHVTRAQAKKTWRELLVQYHPDKVAHLAPEFRALAETKTRALNEAWATLEPALPDD